MIVTDLSISRSKNPGVKGERSLPDGSVEKQFTAHMFYRMHRVRHRFGKVTVGHNDLRTMDRGS
jgi:hypothetical protein